MPWANRLAPATGAAGLHVVSSFDRRIARAGARPPLYATARPPVTTAAGLVDAGEFARRSQSGPGTFTGPCCS